MKKVSTLLILCTILFTLSIVYGQEVLKPQDKSTLGFIKVTGDVKADLAQYSMQDKVILVPMEGIKKHFIEDDNLIIKLTDEYSKGWNDLLLQMGKDNTELGSLRWYFKLSQEALYAYTQDANIIASDIEPSP